MLIVRAATVHAPGRLLREGWVAVEGERIVAVGDGDSPPPPGEGKDEG